MATLERRIKEVSSPPSGTLRKARLGRIAVVIASSAEGDSRCPYPPFWPAPFAKADTYYRED